MRTPNQVREDILEKCGDVSTDDVRAITKFARECTEERKADPETYLKCPRCYGYHSYHGTFDNLCDSCVRVILRDFPNHESVPHIKASFAKFKKPQ